MSTGSPRKATLRPGTPHRQTGTGPGPIAPDGSPVQLYAQLEARDEPLVISAAIPAGARILELGCGAGRVTHVLARLGHDVVAVDELDAMLAAFPDVEASPDHTACSTGRVDKVCSSIEDLRLDTTFDVVLLASQLVNSTDPAARRRMLDTCRRHVAGDGVVLIQRHDTSFLTEPLTREGPTSRFVVRDLRHYPNGVVSGALEYHLRGNVWTQTVWVQNLTDDDLRVCLQKSGLRLRRFLTDDRTWLSAEPVSSAASLA